jgi:ATP-dependent DNA helicase RecQ
VTEATTADLALGDEALALLQRLTGNPASAFHDDQLGAIEALVGDRRRVLLVQRTGWGKSAVYFIATRMLRDRGAGPTLLVSPLLALMRNQIEAAERMDVRAVTINSTNRDAWSAIEERLDAGEIDVLLISPERLANPKFRAEVLPSIGARSGLLVVDEAHCISDWGHDFRPDYRRLVRVLDLLPTGVPVLCCTATANNRVVEDVTSQLGSNLAPIRGPLGREGLRLHALDIAHPAERLAWLAETVPTLPGTGIVYCMTIADVERVAAWLRFKGISAAAYSGRSDPADRVATEQALLDNDVKVVVATSALGMGFDKPDLHFVVHFQSPGSPIAYYQQVGRAGRALDESWGVLVRGREDRAIQDFFVDSAFPDAADAQRVIAVLEEAAVALAPDEILGAVNIGWGQMEQLMKVLEVEGAVERDGSRWLRTLTPWTFDHDRVESVTALRRAEQTQMADYIASDGCRMEMLRGFLDDPAPQPCGMCDNCTGDSLASTPSPAAVQEAVEFLRGSDLVIEPRKQRPPRKKIPDHLRLETGRMLAVWGDGGWGRLVVQGREAGGFEDELVEAAAALIGERWKPEPAPTWVTAVPSQRHPGLIEDAAERLAAALGLQCEHVVVRTRDAPPQATMHNTPMQYENVRGAFAVEGELPTGPVLLVDDTVDSRWTLTSIGYGLRAAGAGPVYPFVFASTTGRTTG